MPVTPEEVSAILATTTWKFIGHGTYNSVYLSETELTIGGHTQKWVKKVPRVKDEPLSNNERAVRKWNSIHLNPEDKAYVSSEGVWVAPYFGNIPAQDKAIADEVLAIYLRTRELIIDACGDRNFLFHKGKAKCVDVDYSRRRGSIASDDLMGWGEEEEEANYLKRWKFGDVVRSVKSPIPKPETTSMIYTLLYIETYLSSEQVKNEYLTEDMIKKIRHLRIEAVPLTPEIMETLLGFPALSVESYADSLGPYIERLKKEAEAKLRVRVEAAVRAVEEAETRAEAVRKPGGWWSLFSLCCPRRRAAIASERSGLGRAWG